MAARSGGDRLGRVWYLVIVVSGNRRACLDLVDRSLGDCLRNSAHHSRVPDAKLETLYRDRDGSLIKKVGLPRSDSMEFRTTRRRGEQRGWRRG